MVQNTIPIRNRLKILMCGNTSCWLAISTLIIQRRGWILCCPGRMVSFKESPHLRISHVLLTTGFFIPKLEIVRIRRPEQVLWIELINVLGSDQLDRYMDRRRDVLLL